MIEKLTKNLIPLAIVAAAVVIAGAVIYINISNPSCPEKEKEGVLTIQEAGEKAINFINQNILKGQATASLVNIIEESGLYKLTFTIEDREFTSHVAKDGKLLFLEGVDLDQESPSSPGEESEPSQETPKTEEPNVKLFIMSFCPFGNQAEELMMPVVELLGEKVDIEPHYVIYSNYGGGGPEYCEDEDNKYCSMHGIQELHQGVRELCVYKYQKERFWDFLKEINKNCSSQNADTCWEAVAKNMGIDVQKIKDCQKNETLSLLEEELALNKKYGVGGSPQLFINDLEYKGERNSEGYKTGVCAAFQDPPEECQKDLGNDGGSVEGGC